MADEDDIFSDEEFKKIARDVKALKGEKMAAPAASQGIFSAPRRSDIIKDEAKEGVRGEPAREINVEKPRMESMSNTHPQAEGCVFCKIVAKEIPARVILDNDDFLAFLDIQPKAVGHTTIVSKRHVEDYCSLDVTEQNSLSESIAKIVARMKKRLNATGYSIVSANGASSGQTVPHFSIHIIPTYSPNAVELPIMSLVQPQKVPMFVHDVVYKLLATDDYAGGAAQKSTYSGFKR